MIRTKLTKLACIAMLALGISATASADPMINVSYSATQTGSDLDGFIFDLDFTVLYDDVCILTSTCNPNDVGLWGIEVYLDALTVVSVDPFPLDGLWDTDVFGTDVVYTLDYFDVPLIPTLSFSFGMTVNVGTFFGYDPDVAFSWGDYGSTYLTATQTGITFCEPSCNGEPVPEPGTLALFGLGLFGLGAARRRRKIKI